MFRNKGINYGGFGASGVFGSAQFSEIKSWDATNTQYDPMNDSSSLLWWDPHTPKAGNVSSWIDRIVGVEAAQANAVLQPSQNDTAIAGAYAGVISQGGKVLVAADAASVIDGHEKLTLTFAAVDSLASSSATIMCYGDDVSATDGTFGVFVNQSGISNFAGALNGGSGAAQIRASESLNIIKIVSIGFDYTLEWPDIAVTFIRVNGVAQSVSVDVADNVISTAGYWPLHLFAQDSTGLNSWAGTLGDVLLRATVSQDGNLQLVERWMGKRVGLAF